MQIPKQPRTKASTAEATQQESKPAGNRTEGASTGEDLNKHLQRACSSYVENINSANLQAQLEHAKAYLAYLENLQQHPVDPALDYYKEVLQAYDNRQAAADAHKKFALASIDQQAARQKTVTDAATAYSQRTRDIWEKLQSEVGQYNKEVAESLKDALVKVNVDITSLPALSLLYQGIRTMNATSDGNGGGTKTV